MQKIQLNRSQINRSHKSVSLPKSGFNFAFLKIEKIRYFTFIYFKFAISLCQTPTLVTSTSENTSSKSLYSLSIAIVRPSSCEKRRKCAPKKFSRFRQIIPFLFRTLFLFFSLSLSLSHTKATHAAQWQGAADSQRSRLIFLLPNVME